MVTTKVTRVEVISQDGREITLHNLKSVELSYQDEDRTLKIFIKK
jgi:hypothetical protein